jgi:hypothetical protein
VYLRPMQPQRECGCEHVYHRIIYAALRFELLNEGIRA